MPQSAYIKLVDESTQQTITLDEVKQKLKQYIEQTSYTGKQLNWNYAEAAFPYTIEHRPEGEGKWFYLKGNDPHLYKGFFIGIDAEPVDTEDANNVDKRHFIQIVLPDDATHGDKGKGNEFCKYLAKQFKGELHLFNGRIMYFNESKS